MFSVVLVGSAQSQLTPRDVAQQVADRLVAETTFTLAAEHAEARQGGVYPIDFAAALGPADGGVFIARSILTLPETVEPLHLAVSHDPGALEVVVNGQVVHRGRDTTPATFTLIDYDLVRMERSVAMPGAEGAYEVVIRFRPEGSAARLYLNLIDPATFITVRSPRFQAPRLSDEAFVIAGPLPVDTPTPAFEMGQAIRWTIPPHHLVSAIAEPLAYSDWRYFTGTFLDGLAEVQATFEELSYQTYMDAHLDFFLSHREAVAEERAAYGLVESAFGHYFRYNLLDDIGMQTVPFLERLKAQYPDDLIPPSALRSTPEGELVTRALDHIMNDATRLPDGTFARLNPDSLTIWADDLFMGGVLLIKAAAYLDGEAKMAAGASGYLNEAIRQTLAMDRYLYDPATGVYWHGYFARDGQPSSSRWGRANGWTMMAKTELLRTLPSAHPQYAAVLTAFQRHAEGLLRHQSADGRWHQVLNQPETYLETSATAMFVRAFAEGMVQGWLTDSAFAEGAMRGWAVMTKHVRPDGRVEGIVRGTPIFFSDEAYDNHAPRLHDPRGLGAVLHAAAAMHRLFEQQATRIETASFVLTNTLDTARPEAAVVLNRDALANWPEMPIRVLHDGQEVPSQQDDLDGDGRWDELFFLVDLAAQERTTITVEATPAPAAYIPRTQAYMAVKQGGRFVNGVYEGAREGYYPFRQLDIPVQHQQDSTWPMFEGPVWESDLVGYRYYLDARNRVDVFGKRVPEPVLHAVTGDYHAINDWGTDVLKVGSSLGLGTPAAQTAEGLQTLGTAKHRAVEVVANGPLRSILRTTYRDWEVEGTALHVVSDLVIQAGQRWTEQRLRITNAAGQPISIPIATGIVKHPAAPALTTGIHADHRYGLTWGAQTDKDNGLGMAVLLPERYTPLPLPDDLSHAYTLQPDDGILVYRYAAAWALERDPIASAEAFATHLHDVAVRWNTPVQITRP